MTMTTRSAGAWSSCRPLRTLRPNIDPPLGLTGMISPAKPEMRRFCSTAPPDEVGRSPAPTTATLRGAKKAPRSRATPY
jgi:hypothetical protein